MTGTEKDQKIQTLEKENKALREKIAELERRLGLNSDNSSKPPSSDGLKKKQKRTKSLRSQSKRSSQRTCPHVGQKGHQGETLKQTLKPDRIINHSAPTSCEECGCSLGKSTVVSSIKRQVFDLLITRQREIYG